MAGVATPELCLGILDAFTFNTDAGSETRRNPIDLGALSLALQLESLDGVDASRGTRMAQLLPPMLDALAAFCLHKANQSQVYATSISITKENITLYVAENNGVPDAVITHLRTIWALIVELNASIPPNARSPKNPGQTLMPSLGHNLAVTIYEFSLPVLRKRFKKRAEVFTAFLRFTAGQDILALNSDLAGHFLVLSEQLADDSAPASGIARIMEFILEALRDLEFFSKDKEALWATREELFFKGTLLHSIFFGVKLTPSSCRGWCRVAEV